MNFAKKWAHKEGYFVHISLILMISSCLTGIFFTDIAPRAAAQGPWENIQSISKTVEIPPGEEYFVYFDSDSGSLVEMTLPSQKAGLTQKAIDALEQVPSWMYDDLAKKFAELGDTTVDVGDFATPTFADMDADGDLDLSVGSEEGEIYYFENVGTMYRPIFILDTEMYLSINTILGDVTNTALAIADLDADGDNDLLLGIFSGTLYLFENVGSPSQAIWGPYDSLAISVNGNSHPSLADLDNDGDYDLAVGSADGYIAFYDNEGDPESPSWVYSYRMFTGANDDRPVCLADIDDDDDFDLSVGDGDLAKLYFYRNIGSPEGEIWGPQDATMYSGITPEYGTSPAIADLDGDMRPDLAVGGFSGRVFSYKNTGTARVPQWLIWSSYQAAEGYMYYPKDTFITYRAEYHQDRYAGLILNASSQYRDEIGFAIAHMPTDNLKSLSNNQSLIFVDNAELIYEIDQYLDYVDVIEKGDYTTTRYRFGEPGNTQERELPRDIYYWYIVHPKITDENVYYIHPNSTDPNTPTDPSQGGRFWREYLFFHNDTSYPADNSGSPSDGVDDYPLPGIGPPLLKELLDGVDVLFNGTTWFAPGGNYSRFQFTGEDDVRPLDYGQNAVVRVSNWVGKTLPLNQQEVSDDERPLQPVRIAHHHNGNCGELQDLTTAAARTALIPAAGVLLLGEDHVWIEFYENGWHQWDNYWSDGGSVIDNFDNYWVGWGERGGSGIHKHNGDDDAWEVTDQYIPEEDLNYVTIRVVDNSGNPVDGARVLVVSYWLTIDIEGFQVDIPFPCIWNYTDSNGESLFKLATQERGGGNHNFTFKVISKVGSFESGKMELEHGQEYTFTFFLEGSVPDPELDHDTQTNPDPPDPRYKLGMNYQVKDAYQRPRNLLTGHYHPEEIPPEEPPEPRVLDFTGNHVDSFLTTGQEITNFMKGYSFESYEFSENSNSNALEFILTEDDDWYFILSNRDSIETTKVIELNLDLLFKPPPHSVKILEPLNGAQLQIGDIIPVSGIISNETDLSFLEISTDGGSTWTSLSPVGNEWTYYWNTASLERGMFIIEARATFGATQNSDAIDVELVDMVPPDLEIQQPGDDSVFNMGQTVSISGIATDELTISDLEISIDGGITWIDILPSLSGGHWSYNWETAEYEPGGYIIMAQASDGSQSTLDTLHIELQDLESPTVAIFTPNPGSRPNIGGIVNITGEASDNRDIVSLRLSTDSGGNWTDITSSLNNTQWSYEWDTSGLKSGWYSLMINASDGTHNSSATVDIELADMEEPIISITYPGDDEHIGLGSEIIIRGKARDNVKIEDLELNTRGGTWIDILPSLSSGQWSFNWDTNEHTLGTVTIKLRASDGTYLASDSITVELVDMDRPQVAITSPIQGEDINCGDAITITGTAFDNIAITELSISLDFGITWISILPSLSNGQWSHEWDTTGLTEGIYTLRVAASDGVNEPSIVEVEIDLVDLEMPVLAITSPGVNAEYEAGAVIPIMGTASDNVGISELEISTDNGLTWITMESSLRNGRWQYDWDTEDMEGGTYVIRVRAADGTYEVEESVALALTGGAKDEEALFSLPLILFPVILIAVLVIATVSVFLIRRGRKKKDTILVQEWK